METLLGKISSSLGGPLELILFIGAGSCVDLSDYAALRARQFIFVEGDPDAAERVVQALAGEATCRVLSELVTPNGARTRFYRYNLPWLNGTLPLGGLQSLYPRLKVVETLELSSKTLSTVLETIPLSGPGKRLLIVDIPGQETALLESVSPEQLHVFDWILVRGCETAFQEGAQSIAATIGRLGERGFESIAMEDESDPAWPFVLLHFDRRLADLYRESETRARLLVEQTTENRRQAGHIVDLEAQLSAGRSELDLARQQNDQQARRVAELEAQLDSSRAGVESVRHQLAELSQKVGAGESAKVQQEQLRQELSHFRHESYALKLASNQVLREILWTALTRRPSFQQQLEALSKTPDENGSAISHSLDFFSRRLIIERIGFSPNQPVVATVLIGDDFSKHVAKCIESNQEYCARHGYSYALLRQFSGVGWSRSASWAKIPLVYGLLQQGHQNILLLDADAMVTNHQVTLEPFFERMAKAGKDLMFAEDITAMNAGVFFTRNTPYARILLDLIFQTDNDIHHQWWEQQAVLTLVDRVPAVAARILIEHRSRLFNSSGNLGLQDGEFKWERGDFICHFAGVHGETLPRYMKIVYDQINR